MYNIRVGYVFKNHAEAALLRAVSGDQRPRAMMCTVHTFSATKAVHKKHNW